MRVAFVPRSTEIKPLFFDLLFCDNNKHICYHPFLFYGMEGGSGFWVLGSGLYMYSTGY